MKAKQAIREERQQLGEKKRRLEEQIAKIEEQEKALLRAAEVLAAPMVASGVVEL